MKSLIPDEDDESRGTAILGGPRNDYRYLLTRGRLSDPFVLFVMLNPSKADALVNDQTIDWCWRWSNRNNHPSLRVCNLYAWRETSTAELRKRAREGINIIGPDNDRHIQYQASRARLVVCGWGSGGGLFGKHFDGRNRDVMLALRRVSRPHYLRLSDTTGQPWHPLYLPGDIQATPFP